MKSLVKAINIVVLMIGMAVSAQAADSSDVKIPKVEKINKIYVVTLDAETPFGRGYQHGAALKYVIHKGIAQWKQWINENLGEQDPDIEIAEFIHDTDFLDGIRKHLPNLYEELQGIAKGAEVDFNLLYANQMFDEFVMYVTQKYRLEHCTGLGVYGRKALATWQASDHPSASDRVAEYRRLLSELESEIKQFLHDAVKSFSS
jgi:hypothetical protein